MATSCPGCGHLPTSHVGGTCFECGNVFRYQLDVRRAWVNSACGWVLLGNNNKWQVEPGWYPGNYLNLVAEALPEGQRPILRIIHD